MIHDENIPDLPHTPIYQALMDSVPFVKELQRNPTCLEVREKAGGHVLIFRNAQFKGSEDSAEICRDYYMGGVHSLLYGMLSFHPEIGDYSTSEPINHQNGTLTVSFNNDEHDGDIGLILAQFLADNGVNYINASRYHSPIPKG